MKVDQVISNIGGMNGSIGSDSFPSGSTSTNLTWDSSFNGTYYLYIQYIQRGVNLKGTPCILYSVYDKLFYFSRFWLINILLIMSHNFNGRYS